MTTELQMTFGETVGLAPMVPTATLPTDLVECVDTGEMIARADATFDKHGDAYEDDSDLVECPECYENVHCDEADENGGWCEECNDELRYTCSCCNEWALREDSRTTTGGDEICEDCADNYYSWCDECEGYADQDGFAVINECHCVCADCLRRNYTRCDDCGEYESDSDIRETAAGNNICESCYRNDYSTCDNCGDIVPDHDIDGDGYCSECAEEDEEDEYVAPPRPTVTADATVPTDGETYPLGSDLDSDRTWGVEIELSRVPGYYDREDKLRRKGWHCGRDGSVNGDDREYSSPILAGNDGLRKLREVTDILKGCGADSSAGLHTHFGMGDLDDNARKAVALAYHYTCDVWHAFVDSRRDNYRYCRRHNAKYGRRDIIAASDMRYIVSSDRYIWMNWRALSSHGTLEIRLHHGTCDGYEIQSWVKAHVRFIDAVSKLTVAQVTRVFGGKDRFAIFAELSRIWDDAELTDYYATKARRSGRPVRKVDAA